MVDKKEMNWDELKSWLINSKYYYFHTENGVLLCGDCLEILPKFPEESIDLVLTDPPYGVIGKDKGYNQDWDTFVDEEHFEYITKRWLSLIFKILKKGGQVYIFWSQKKMFSFFKLISNTKFTFQRMLIWHHPNLAKPTNKMYLWTYDPVFYFTKGEKANFFSSKFVNKYNVDVFSFPKPQNWGKNRKRFHPAEKPIELIKIFLSNSSQKNDIIIDIFAGSGSTLLACEKLNRRWIGIEINPEYCEIAKKRIEEEIKQKKLF